MFNEIIFFVAMVVFSQVFFYFFREKSIWIGYTVSIIGVIFGWTIGFAIEIFFWLGYVTLIIGVLISLYIISEKRFLPEIINKILYYHPKLQGY